jgi:hypothetical protein
MLGVENPPGYPASGFQIAGYAAGRKNHFRYLVHP